MDSSACSYVGSKGIPASNLPSLVLVTTSIPQKLKTASSPQTKLLQITETQNNPGGRDLQGSSSPTQKSMACTVIEPTALA